MLGVGLYVAVCRSEYDHDSTGWRYSYITKLLNLYLTCNYDHNEAERK